MITNKQLENLRRFKISSWAIWGNKDKDSLLDFFKLRKGKLHGKVIFLGLNRSIKRKGQNVYTNKNYEFNNFHNVKRLKKCIRGKNLIGSYITDFYKDFDPVAKNLNNKTLRQKRNALKRLFKQIKIFRVNHTKKSTIICFGDDVFNHLRDSLRMTIADEKLIKLNKNNDKSKIVIRSIKSKYENIEMTVFRVCHYSANNRGKKFETRLTIQLGYINKKLTA